MKRKIPNKLYESLSRQIPPHISEINQVAKTSPEDAARMYFSKKAIIQDRYKGMRSWN